MVKALIFLSTLWFAVLGTASAESQGVPIAFGGGFSVMGYANVQKVSYSVLSDNIAYSYSSFGLNAFLDITKYLTFTVGYRMGYGDFNTDITGSSPSSSKYSSNVNQLEIGGEAKYPVALYWGSISPKIGILDVIYSNGEPSGFVLNDDGKHVYSPLLLTLGADVNFNLSPSVILRFPLDLGFALNSKLSDTYYSTNLASVPYTYISSVGVSLRLGVEIGYQL